MSAEQDERVRALQKALLAQAKQIERTNEMLLDLARLVDQLLENPGAIAAAQFKARWEAQKRPEPKRRLRLVGSE